MIIFGQRVKELREEKKLTQVELGKLLGLSYQTIGHYENGTTQPTLETLAKMCEIFDVTASYLLGLEDI
ncbi:MAG: helix-turn-helix domain-containing protein [Firmicutes bacterium]|nr:helix-turn-helix domain-containing protein [Bacillota bacterium]